MLGSVVMVWLHHMVLPLGSFVTAWKTVQGSPGLGITCGISSPPPSGKASSVAANVSFMDAMLRLSRAPRRRFLAFDATRESPPERKFSIGGLQLTRAPTRCAASGGVAIGDHRPGVSGLEEETERLGNQLRHSATRSANPSPESGT